MNYHALRALSDMAKHGGNYFGTIHAEGMKSQRLAEARAEAERIHQRDRGERKEDTADARSYQAEQDETKRTWKKEDSRENVDYQIEQQDAASARRNEAARIEAEEKGTIKTFYDADGKPTSFKVNAYGKLEPLDELEGLSDKNPKEMDKNFKETDSQRRNNGYLVRMSDSSHQMKKIADEQNLDVAEMNQQLLQYSDINLIKDPALRQYATNMSDWVRSKLRKESGAVIGVEEAMDEIKTYFPQVGDTKADIEEKRRKRAVAEFSLYTEVKGTKATKDDFVADFGDPFGLFYKSSKSRGRDNRTNPDDIESALKELGL